MADYIVATITPFKNKVSYKVVSTIEEVESIISSKRSSFNDVVVIKREIDSEGVEKLTLQKSGYAKIYNLINKIFVLLGVIMLFLISYLYYKIFIT